MSCSSQTAGDDALTPARPGAATATRADPAADARVVAATLATVAGLIHVKAFVDHLDHYWLHAVLFALVAIGQMALGVVLWRRPVVERVLVPAAIVTLGVVAVWIVSRSVGLPFGPEAGEPEAVGVADTFASFIELITVALIAAMVRPHGWFGKRLTWVRGDQAVRLAMTLGSSGLIAALFGGHAH